MKRRIDRDTPPDVKIRPRKPARESNGNLSPAFRMLMATTRRLRNAARPRSGGTPINRPSFAQRCAVRVTYSPNKTAGQWKAHGKYLARDSASHAPGETPELRPDTGLGFNAQRDDVNIPAELERWQNENDPRMWKLILSPEFGERLDLKKLTREVLAKMERDLGTKLEWTGIAHFNTEHPHVHVSLRGVRDTGAELRLEPSYIKNGIRKHAEHFCTVALGYRTQEQALESERREIPLRRFTSLDRLIQKQQIGVEEIAFNPAPIQRIHLEHVYARLRTLEEFHLARNVDGQWRVKADFARVLAALAKTADKQRILQAHGAMVSDPRLPFSAARFKAAEGRILVHGEDEQSGQPYLILEGVDAKLHYVPYSLDIEEARASGKLKTNSFVRLQRQSKTAVTVEDLGPAKYILENRAHFDDAARSLIHAGSAPPRGEWKGWLGSYHAALYDAYTAELGRTTAAPGSNQPV